MRGSGPGHACDPSEEFCQDFKVIVDIRVLMFLSLPVWSSSSESDDVLLLLLLHSGVTLHEDIEETKYQKTINTVTAVKHYLCC